MIVTVIVIVITVITVITPLPEPGAGSGWVFCCLEQDLRPLGCVWGQGSGVSALVTPTHPSATGPGFPPHSQGQPSCLHPAVPFQQGLSCVSGS